MLRDPSIRLKEAIINGNILIVKIILRRWPELLDDIDSKNGWNCLHYASFYGRYLICVFLMQLGRGKLELLRTFKNNLPIHLSLFNGHEQTTHLLLQHSPQILDAKGYSGWTPAHISCLHNYPKCLSLLISLGCNLINTDDEGNTPLHIAMEYGSVDCMKLLLIEFQQDEMLIKNNSGWTPLEVTQTYEMEKLFEKMQKNFNSFETPIPSLKSVFESKFSLPVMDSNGSLINKKVPSSSAFGLSGKECLLNTTQSKITIPQVMSKINYNRLSSISSGSSKYDATLLNNSSFIFNKTRSSSTSSIQKRRINGNEVKSNRINDIVYTQEGGTTKANMVQSKHTSEQFSGYQESVNSNKRESLLDITISKIRNDT